MGFIGLIPLALDCKHLLQILPENNQSGYDRHGRVYGRVTLIQSESRKQIGKQPYGLLTGRQLDGRLPDRSG